MEADRHFSTSITHRFAPHLTLLPAGETLIGLKAIVCFDNDPQKRVRDIADPFFDPFGIDLSDPVALCDTRILKPSLRISRFTVMDLDMIGRTRDFDPA